jgi:hypothetical protein
MVPIIFVVLLKLWVINFDVFWMLLRKIKGDSLIDFFNCALKFVGGPGQGFEPWQKAPQASRLPSYLTPATFAVFECFCPSMMTWLLLFSFFSRILSCPFHRHNRMQALRDFCFCGDFGRKQW